MKELQKLAKASPLKGNHRSVKNNASPVLKQIRKDINNIRGKIGASFSSALSKAISVGYLDDIKETVVDNQRVLAVSAMYRKKVAGSLLGSSKSLRRAEEDEKLIIEILSISYVYLI